MRRDVGLGLIAALVGYYPFGSVACFLCCMLVCLNLVAPRFVCELSNPKSAFISFPFSRGISPLETSLIVQPKED